MPPLRLHIGHECRVRNPLVVHMVMRVVNRLGYPMEFGQLLESEHAIEQSPWWHCIAVGIPVAIVFPLFDLLARPRLPNDHAASYRPIRRHAVPRQAFSRPWLPFVISKPPRAQPDPTFGRRENPGTSIQPQAAVEESANKIPIPTDGACGSFSIRRFPSSSNFLLLHVPAHRCP
jgi:hypothetical protein